MDWIDTIWTGAMWVLLGTAAAVMAWAVLGDWWRGRRANRRGGERRRCSRCWYDMRGIAGLRCPECGRAAKSEHGLQRSRVRWRGMMVGLVVLVPAWVAAKMPEVRVGGWGRLVPTAVLACWPTDVEAWLSNRWTDWAGRELSSRWADQNPGWVGERVLTWRLAKKWQREGDWEVAILDTSEIERASPPNAVTPRPANRNGATQGWRVIWPARDLSQLVHDVISPDSWELAGGNEARVWPIGNRLVVACPPSQLSRIRVLLDTMASPAAKHDTAQFEDLTIFGSRHVGSDVSEDRRRDLGNLLIDTVERNGWEENGGDEASMNLVCGRIVVRGPESTRARCGAVLRAVQECSPRKRRVESGDLSFVCLDRLPACTSPVVDPSRVEDEQRALRTIATEVVDIDRWEDGGGDDAFLRLFTVHENPILVLGGDLAMRERAIRVVEGVLLNIDAQEPLRLGGSPRIMSPGVVDTEYVAIWPVRRTLRAWGAMTDHEFSAWVADDPEARDPEKARDRVTSEGYAAPPALTAERSRDDASRRLLEALRATNVDFDDQDLVRLHLFDGVLVQWTVKRELLDAVEAAIAGLERGPRAKLDKPETD